VQITRTAAKLLTRDEARRIAANIAKIPAYRRSGAASQCPLRNAAACDEIRPMGELANGRFAANRNFPAGLGQLP